MKESTHPTVSPEEHDGLRFQVLRDPASGSEAWVLPEVGASVVHFETRIGERSLEIIRLPESWDAFRGHPTQWGTGVLFPFPGRLRGGRFSFGGRSYQLELNDPEAGNAIHGYVAWRRWSLLQTFADGQRGATAVFGIGMDSDDDLRERYPFPFRLTMAIQLRAGHLHYHFVAENLGTLPMPMGLGLHPYFPLPLGGLGDPDDCEIWVDAPYYWNQEAALPVGSARRVENAIDLRAPRSLRALASVGVGGPNRMINLLYSQFSDRHGPGPADAGIRCGVRNPRAGCEVVVVPGNAFAACVVYVPPSRDRISFEPHTCVPNAFNLVAEGKTAGTITLGPREFWRASIHLGARSLS